MNVKRILLIGLILVAIAASLSIVSADNSVNIGGVDFNIPDGYIEDEKLAKNGTDSFTTNDGEIPGVFSYKVFEKGPDIIRIQVLEFNSPDDAKKVYDHDNEEYKESLNETTKTINGYDGIYSTKNGFYGFSYCKDKRYIMVVMNDESLLESIISK